MVLGLTKCAGLCGKSIFALCECDWGKIIFSWWCWCIPLFGVVSPFVAKFLIWFSLDKRKYANLIEFNSILMWTLEDWIGFVNSKYDVIGLNDTTSENTIKFNLIYWL